MSPRVRTLIGLLIAAIGLSLAWVAYERSFRRPAPSAGPAPVVLSTATKARLDSIQIDARPTDETAASLIEQAVDRVRMLAEQTPGLSARAGDLADAFRERLAALVIADFERNVADLSSRGYRSVRDGDPADWERRTRDTRLTAFGIEQVEVQFTVKDGRPQPDPPREDGLNGPMSRLAGNEFLAELNEAGRDAVEVRLPIEHRELFLSRDGGEARPGGLTKVIVGYEFTWSPTRGLWIPSGTRMYANPNEVHGAVQLF